MEAVFSAFNVITLRGESDAFVAPRIRSDLATALGSEAPIVVDLTQAAFFEITGLSALLPVVRTWDEASRRVGV